MIDSHTADEIAKMIVEEYLICGPGESDIWDSVYDELGSDVELEDVQVVASTVRATLTNLAKNFSLA